MDKKDNGRVVSLHGQVWYRDRPAGKFIIKMKVGVGTFVHADISRGPCCVSVLKEVGDDIVTADMIWRHGGDTVALTYMKENNYSVVFTQEKEPEPVGENTEELI